MNNQPVSTISIQKWILKVVPPWRAMGHPLVSTISIQKWILKEWRHTWVSDRRRVSTISIQKWILKVADYHQGDRRDRVSTISIQKWILKVQHQQARRRCRRSFNNIDPEVDTESCQGQGVGAWSWSCFNNIDPEVDTERNNMDALVWIITEFQQYRSRSGYWKSLHGTGATGPGRQFQQYRSRSGYWKCGGRSQITVRLLVSTISIQKWILKERAQVKVILDVAKFQQYRSRSGYWKREWEDWSARSLPSFNNIDPEVDTESTLMLFRSRTMTLFQQYRSRSGYWKIVYCLSWLNWTEVSTISIQKWILKDARWSKIFSFSSRFQQYRSRSGYWKSKVNWRQIH